MSPILLSGLLSVEGGQLDIFHMVWFRKFEILISRILHNSQLKNRWFLVLSHMIGMWLGFVLQSPSIKVFEGF